MNCSISGLIHGRSFESYWYGVTCTTSLALLSRNTLTRLVVAQYVNSQYDVITHSYLTSQIAASALSFDGTLPLLDAFPPSTQWIEHTYAQRVPSRRKSHAHARKNNVSVAE